MFDLLYTLILFIFDHKWCARRYTFSTCALSNHYCMPIVVRCRRSILLEYQTLAGSQRLAANWSLYDVVVDINRMRRSGKYLVDTINEKNQQQHCK